MGGPDHPGAPPGLSAAGGGSPEGEGEGDACGEEVVEVEEPFVGEVVNVVISC